MKEPLQRIGEQMALNVLRPRGTRIAIDHGLRFVLRFREALQIDQRLHDHPRALGSVGPIWIARIRLAAETQNLLGVPPRQAAQLIHQSTIGRGASVERTRSGNRHPRWRLFDGAPLRWRYGRPRCRGARRSWWWRFRAATRRKGIAAVTAGRDPQQ